MKYKYLLLAVGLFISTTAFADVTLPHFFSDHMVLQRESQAAIWGNASANSVVSVSFKGETARVNAGENGKWKVSIATGDADSKGAKLVVTSEGDSVTINDVLVGEVWLASGQSNMVFTMNRVPAYADLIAKSDHPPIRMFNAPTVTSVEPQENIPGEWTTCSPSTVPSYSAVAFFFARKLHAELGIPIGVIKTAWGGKPVETFTSREALETLPATNAMVEQAVAADQAYDDKKAQIAYQARLDQWQAAAAEQRKLPADKRRRLPRKPTPPKRPLSTEGKPGVLFNSMIHPFVGYTIKGAIWYQGEANAKPGAVPYDQTLPLMIRDWRDRWGDEFSFYFVQLANFRDPSTEPGTADAWALLQDRMRLVLDTTPKTGMAIINDVGDAKDIHPKNKRDPGERLARWALAKDYGQPIVCSGPLFQTSEVDGNAIRITFRHVGSGLKTRAGGPLKRFEISGGDREWHWADAKIDSPNSVLVRCAEVQAPVAVRYAWASNPEGANLVNSEGLPASVFRTDDWDDGEVTVGNATARAATERRQLAAEIKALNAKRDRLDRNSDEYRLFSKKHREMMLRWKANKDATPAKP